MFLITDDSQLQYLPCGQTIPEKQIWLTHTSPPYFGNGDKSGTQVVINYVNELIGTYRADARTKDTIIDKMYQRALTIDGQDPMIDVECDIPSLRGLMNAAVQMGMVKNAKVGYINQINTLKNYIRNYKAVVVETKFYDSVHQINNFNVEQLGTLLTEDISKGFVAVGYDNDGILLQNSRGVKCGSLGFHKMKWDVFKQMFIKGALFVDA